MATGTRGAGEFCWINMLTPRPDEAREFFGRVLGWTYFEMRGLGHGIKVGGRDVGGLFDLEGPNTPAGLPPYIGVMVKVENADTVGAKVASLGGRAKPAFDVMGQGRMAVCVDPDGAEFDVWEPHKMLGTDVDGNLHGAPSWFDVMTTDVHRAADFYSGLFGWTPEPVRVPGSTHTTFHNGAGLVSGARAFPPGAGDRKPHWATYFTVTDADEAAGLAVGLGAGVSVPPHDVPGAGRICGLTSPQGVAFHVIAHAR